MPIGGNSTFESRARARDALRRQQTVKKVQGLKGLRAGPPGPPPDAPPPDAPPLLSPPPAGVCGLLE